MCHKKYIELQFTLFLIIIIPKCLDLIHAREINSWIGCLKKKIIKINNNKALFCASQPAWMRTSSWQLYLDLLHLLFISDVHLLQGVLQLLVPLQQSLSQLRGQVEVWESETNRERDDLIGHEGSEREMWMGEGEQQERMGKNKEEDGDEE